MPFGHNGFIFDPKAAPVAVNQPVAKSGRGGGKNPQLDVIQEMIEEGDVYVADVCSKLGVDAQRAGYLLRQLEQAGKLNSFGRGAQRVFRKAGITL